MNTNGNNKNKWGKKLSGEEADNTRGGKGLQKKLPGEK